MVFLAKNSVIPLNFPFKNVFFDIGPLIKPEHFILLITSRAFLNDKLIKLFDSVVIFFLRMKIYYNLYSQD